MISRAEQQCSGIDRSAGNDDDIAFVDFCMAIALDDDLGNFSSRRTCLQALYVGICDERNIGMFQSFIDADDVGIGFGVDETREAIAGVAFDARAVIAVFFIEQQP